MTDVDAGDPFPTADFPFPHHDGLGPIPELAALRRNAPCARIILPSGDPAWLVTRYGDVRTVLADPRFSRTRATRGAGPRMAHVPTLQDSILAADPPEHSRLRKLVAPAFTARRAEAMRSGVARLVDDLLDRLAVHDRPADLVPLLARPLPLAVICDLLGVPREDADRLDAWCDALRNLTAAPDAEVTAAVGEMTGYLTGLVGAKRRRGGEDVLSTLIAARDEGDRLSQDELVSFALVLLTGGYGTTADRLAGSVHLLLDDPERYGRLVREPATVPRAVEELLRYAQTNVQANLRVATEEVRLGGVRIAEGEAVMAINSSANHDESVFDAPDLLDLAREHNPHLGFGHGVHHCVGAQIARVQLQEALAGLVRRFPGLRAAAPPRWKTGLKTRGPRSLPVTW
ncbi:cytochrome P450 [Streptomyces subrutilus]|uniref:Cytochrome P450 n=1 Tax=Streptomyces subrutilus TaxID=36818 RepID=A0A5P2UF73_9ACTN|nr:cytochrome P450 [Streptomyces subrutilus]QEU77115.1 cytochrome P450 [Streptomyces subrutilus]WSJ33923.1 cytochrome P450 [Streptomyces subrutilus]GGZ86694.1 cytochrome P450 [Streptomyces subrutilus]